MGRGREIRRLHADERLQQGIALDPERDTAVYSSLLFITAERNT